MSEAPADLKDNVFVYTWGLVYLSACVPKGMSREVIEGSVNTSHPTGIGSRWHISDKPFKTGESNPCQCADDPARQHFLLSC